MLALGILAVLALLLLCVTVIVLSACVGGRIGDVVKAIDRQTAVLAADDDDGPAGETLPVPKVEAPPPVAARPRALCTCAACRSNLLTHSFLLTEPRAAHVSQGFGVVRRGWA